MMLQDWIGLRPNLVFREEELDCLTADPVWDEASTRMQKPRLSFINVKRQ